MFEFFIVVSWLYGCAHLAIKLRKGKRMVVQFAGGYKVYVFMQLSVLLFCAPIFIFFVPFRFDLLVCYFPFHILLFIPGVYLSLIVKKQLILVGRDEAHEFANVLNEMLLMPFFGALVILMLFVSLRSTC